MYLLTRPASPTSSTPSFLFHHSTQFFFFFSAFQFFYSNTSGHVYNDIRLLLFHVHREKCFTQRITLESDQFRFLRVSHVVNLKDSQHGRIDFRVKFRQSLCNEVYYSHRFVSRSFIPLPRFFNSRRTHPLLTPSLVLFPQHSAWTAHDVFMKDWSDAKYIHHSSSVTLFPLTHIFLFCNKIITSVTWNTIPDNYSMWGLVLPLTGGHIIGSLNKYVMGGGKIEEKDEKMYVYYIS